MKNLKERKRKSKVKMSALGIVFVLFSIIVPLGCSHCTVEKRKLTKGEFQFYMSLRAFAEASIRVYLKKTGKYPDINLNLWEQLKEVTDLGREVERDKFGELAMYDLNGNKVRYTLSKKGHILYSFGRNGIDELGEGDDLCIVIDQ